MLYNYSTIPEFEETILRSVKINVDYQGNIIWNVPFEYTVPFNYDMKYYPFDKQKIDIVIGSWSYDDDKLILELPYNDHIDTKI